MSEDRNWRTEFKKGYDDSGVRNWRNYIGRGALIVGLFAVLFLPVAWYWKIVIYLVWQFVVGLVVQGFAMASERRQQK